MELIRRVFGPIEPVPVDFNALTEEGLVLVRASDFASSSPHQGTLIRIVEPDEEIEGLAHVVRISDKTGLVYLDIDWHSLRDVRVVRVQVQQPRLVSVGSADWSRPQRLAFS